MKIANPKNEHGNNHRTLKMKYYWNSGFYVDEIHFQKDPETDEYIVPDGYIEISEELYKSLLDGQSQGKQIVTGSEGTPVLQDPPKPTLAEMKETVEYNLWKNYKEFQRTYVDPEDLTLANTCAAGGSEKGAAVRQWVLDLWAHYYTVKDQVIAAETEEALNAINITTEGFETPQYTIRELNEEASIALHNIAE